MAGYFDGHGQINLTGNEKVRNIYVSVTHQFKQVIDALIEEYGGSVNSIEKTFMYQVTGNKAYRLLVDIAPYMIIKKSLAETAIKFHELKQHRNIGNEQELQETAKLFFGWKEIERG